MANTDAPRGFWPLRNLDGGQDFRTKKYLVAASQTIYPGDVVDITSAGNTTVAAADAGVSVIGIAATYVASIASSTSQTIMVYDDPNIVFGVQTVTGTSYAAAMVGATCDHVAGSGSTTNYISGHELDISALNTSNAAMQFMILGLIDRPGNAVGAHADVEVVFNQHFLKGAGNAGV